MIKAQPSLFIFNKNSHLEGSIHSNATLSGFSDLNGQRPLKNAELLDEANYEIDEVELDFDEEDLGNLDDLEEIGF